MKRWKEIAAATSRVVVSDHGLKSQQLNTVIWYSKKVILKVRYQEEVVAKKIEANKAVFGWRSKSSVEFSILRL